MDQTPITVGLVTIVFGGISAAILIVLWLQRTLRKLETDIVAAVRIDIVDVRTDLSSEITDLRTDLKQAHERVTTMVLAQSEHRTYVAENYMSKTSATGAIGALTDNIRLFQQTIETRLNRIDTSIENIRQAR